LLFLGRLEKEKGLATLLKGFSQARSNMGDLQLKIAGMGSCYEELRNHIKNINASNIIFEGFKQGHELEKLTKNAKAIIIPSEWYENYPFAGLEAMAYGKPVIASKIGGLPELVDDGTTGFLFEPFNSKQLSAKIDLLNSLSKDEIQIMGRKARKKVEKINNNTDYLKKILNIYHKLI